MIFLATQKTLDVENPTPKDIHTVGTVGIIMRMLKLPDERIKILVQGIAKAKINKYIQTDPYYSVRIDKVPDTKPAATPLEAEAVMRTVKELERAGVAALHIEDQAYPKRAHYHKGIEHVIPPARDGCEDQSSCGGTDRS